MSRFKEIEEQSELLKDMLLKKFPNCNYTIILHLWDDGTHQIICRYGDGDMLYNYRWYNNEVIYEEFAMESNRIKIGKDGKEYFVKEEEK